MKKYGGHEEPRKDNLAAFQAEYEGSIPFTRSTSPARFLFAGNVAGESQ
jgi:hypothetical protein